MKRVATAITAVTGVVASALVGVVAAPAAHAAGSCVDRNLYVVAHEDDDLLFLSPDLLGDASQGHCTRTVFLTAGDAALGLGYAQSREQGIEAAYSQMSGVANSWTTTDAGVPGYNVRMRTLVGNPDVSVVFMRLPDGFGLGTGSAVNNYESMQKLMAGQISSIHSIDGSASYSLSSLRATLAAIFNQFRPDYIHTMDYTGQFDDGDHSDHHATAYLTRDTANAYSGAYELFSHLGYGVPYLPQNVFSPVLDAKRSAAATYGAYDSQVCQGGCFPNEDDLWSQWTKRQYHADETSSDGRVAPPGTTNVARDAGVTVTASSANAAAQQTADKVVDGSTLGSPVDSSREWATQGGKANSWVQLTFPQPVQISRIALYDRPNADDQVTSARLEFSGGQSINVSALDNAGAAKLVDVPQITATSVKVVITGVSASTYNIGLAEVEVYGGEVAPVQPGNVARSAGVVATASSEATAYGQTAAKAIDGSTLGSPDDYTREWATNGGKAGSWLQLAWPSPVTIDRVVLYDRPNLDDNVTAGTLKFSDGSTVQTGPLDPGGGPTVVTFPARTVSNLRFTVDSVSPTTYNIGLAEIEVYSTGTVVNRPPVANAGAAQQTTQGSKVTLDGSKSTDPDGTPLTYQWQQTAGANVALTGATTAKPSFTPTDAGEYEFQLTVSDGQLSASASVHVSVSAAGADGNVARFATATASSERTSEGQSAAKAIDGVLYDGRPWGDYEWVTKSKKAGSWIKLTWASPVTVDHIVLYDRWNEDDQVLAGHLAFSDGTSVGVGALDNGSGPTRVDFAPRTITSVTLTIDEVSASTYNIGLAEFQVFSTSAPVEPNMSRAPGATISASSEVAAFDQTASNVADGIAYGDPLDYTKEWATDGQKAGAWLQVAWTAPVTIDRIVLYDRPNEDDQVTGGTLTFSDGSTVQVGPLDNGFAPTVVTFSPRTVTSVKFTVTKVSASTLNVGLAEFEVYGAAALAAAAVPAPTDPAPPSTQAPGGAPADTGAQGIAPPAQTSPTAPTETAPTFGNTANPPSSTSP